MVDTLRRQRFTNLLVGQTTLSLVTYSAVHVQNSSFTFSESSFSTSRLILLNMKGFKIMWSLESWSKKQMERTEKVEKDLVNNLNNRSTETDGRNRDIWKRILWLPLTTRQPRQMVRTEKFEKGNCEYFLQQINRSKLKEKRNSRKVSNRSDITMIILFVVHSEAYEHSVLICEIPWSIADLFSAWFSMSFENHSLNSSWESNRVGIMKWSSAHNC